MKSCIFVVIATLPTTILASPLPSTPSSSPSSPAPTLTLSANSTLKLSIFSDLHYGENEDSFGIPQDINSTRLTNYILTAEDPDFVVLNGDLITGENTFRENSTQYVDVLVAPFVQRGYQWASTYGNHDSKFNLSREGIYAEERKYENALTRHGPVGTDGVTNYYILVYRSAGMVKRVLQGIFGAPKPVAVLWFFDSRGGSRGDPSNSDNIPNWVSERTVRWLWQQSQSLQNTYGTLPSLAFVHIPTHAFLDLQQQTSPKVSRKHYPGLNADIPLAFQGPSAQNNGSYTEQDEPFMNALLSTPGLHSVYSGHDHGDSWCGRWPGDGLQGPPSKPFICFCKHSGFGGYGSWNRGVRQVELAFDREGSMEVESWVRMETGKIVTRVGLNGTYGVDAYPTADGGYHNY